MKDYIIFLDKILYNQVWILIRLYLNLNHSIIKIKTKNYYIKNNKWIKINLLNKYLLLIMIKINLVKHYKIKTQLYVKN